MSQLNLFKYFKVTLSSPQVVLLFPNGSLPNKIPSTAISATNKEVEEVMAIQSEDTGNSKKEDVNKISSTAFSATNKEVKEAIASLSEDTDSSKKRGCYQKYTPKQKVTIGNYVLINGMSAAFHCYAGNFLI